MRIARDRFVSAKDPLAHTVNLAQSQLLEEDRAERERTNTRGRHISEAYYRRRQRQAQEAKFGKVAKVA
jgi:hypothetical protein